MEQSKADTGSARKRGFFERCRLVLLPLLCLTLFIGFLAAAPTPAYATPKGSDAGWLAKLSADIAIKVKEAAAALKIFKVLDQILTFLKELLNKILDAWKTFGMVVSSGQHAAVEAKTRIAQQLDNNRAADMITGASAETTSKHIDAFAFQMLLCNTIIVRLLEIYKIPFAHQVSRMVATGIPLEYMGAGQNAAAGAYALGDKQSVCGERDPGAPATGHPIDGYPESCIPSAGVELEGMHNEGAILARDLPLSVPTFTTQKDTATNQTYLIPTADQNRGTQMRWMAARNYCYTAAGMKPTPPNHVKAETPEGLRAITQYNHCTAMRSFFIEQCTDRIGLLSRPDCSNPDFDELCKADMAACSAAQKGGIDVPSSFDNCQAGLSLYETQMLSRLMCITDSRTSELGLTGKGYDSALEQNNTCAMMLMAWDRERATEDANWERAAKMMRKANECWQKYDSAMSSLPKSALREDPDAKVHLVKETRPSPRRIEAPVDPKVVRAKLQKDFRDGQPVYADDLLVPAAAR